MLLTVIWLGLLYLQLKFDLVFCGFTVEIRFGIFYLRSPLSGNWIWSCFAYGSPTVGKKDEPQAKRPQLQVKKTHPLTIVNLLRRNKTRTTACKHVKTTLDIFASLRFPPPRWRSDRNSLVFPKLSDISASEARKHMNPVISPSRQETDSNPLSLVDSSGGELAEKEVLRYVPALCVTHLPPCKKLAEISERPEAAECVQERDRESA